MILGVHTGSNPYETTLVRYSLDVPRQLADEIPPASTCSTVGQRARPQSRVVAGHGQGRTGRR